MTKKIFFKNNLSSAVYITSTALARMQAYINSVPGEISGLGEVEPYGEKDFLITDVFIFRQDTSGGHTDIDEDSLVEFLDEALEQGRDLDRVHLWWHSHGRGGAFWSTTDEKTAGVFINSRWMVSIVGNQKGKFRTRVDFFNPRATADFLELYYIPTPDAPTPDDAPIDYEKIAAEVKEKVIYNAPVYDMSVYNDVPVVEGGLDGKDSTPPR